MESEGRVSRHDLVSSWQSTMEELVPSPSPALLRQLTLKVLVIGDPSVGKTALVKRYIHNVFQQHYKQTIGVDFSLKVIQWSPELNIKLQLWDVAGHERLSLATRAYYRHAHGCLLLFDLRDAASWQSVGSWKQDLDSKCRLPDGSPVPCLLIGNKNDLPVETLVVSSEDMATASQRHGFATCRSISVKEDRGVQEAFRFLINEMVSKICKPEERLCFISFSSDRSHVSGLQLGRLAEPARRPQNGECYC